MSKQYYLLFTKFYLLQYLFFADFTYILHVTYHRMFRLVLLSYIIPLSYSKSIPNVIQFGQDGFGHQLEGTLSILDHVVSRRFNYIYSWSKTCTYEHVGKEEEQHLCAYMHKALHMFSKHFEEPPLYIHKRQHVHETWKIPSDLKNRVYSLDNAWRDTHNYTHSFYFLRNAFVDHNAFLPPPTYAHSSSSSHVVVHIRQGDSSFRNHVNAQNAWLTCVLKRVKHDNVTLIVHSDGHLPFTSMGPIKVYNHSISAIQALSDFIHADIFIMAESSLSRAAHILRQGMTLHPWCALRPGVVEKNHLLSPTPTTVHVLGILQRCI